MSSAIRFPEKFPVLFTPRLVLRAVHDTDAPTVFRLYHDPRVMEFRGEAIFRTIGEAEKLIFRWRKLFAEQQGLRWGITWKETGALIGSVGFKQIFHQHLRADMGYELDPDWWNRGIMTEAVKSVSDFGLHELQLHSIEANITPHHVASRRVLEKLGYRLEAHYHENYFYEGWWDSAIWALKK